MKIQPNSKLVMIGDSITDCGRARPIGEATGDGLGFGYVSLVNACLTITHTKDRIRVVNMGIGGNTVQDLAERWSSDVLALKPDWLSVMIGTNDVWRQMDQRLITEKHISIAEYSQTLEKLIQSTRPQLQGLVMMSPFFIEPNPADPMRAMMDQYGTAVHALAKQYDAIFVDTQAAFNSLLSEMHPMALAADRVHPNQTGHMALARAFLNAIEYVW